MQHGGRVDAQGLLHLRLDDVGAGDSQVDLVQHRDNGQFAFHRQICIGDCLRLHALEGIDKENDSLAGSEAARDFVAEIDMAGRVDEVQFIAARRRTRDRSSRDACGS